jgi:DNA-binding YbaB/EbfC family protein
MKHAQKKMEQAQQVQDELANEIVSGSAGGGMVVAEATGLGKITAIRIDPQAVDPDDVEMLQDLILSAINEATEKSEGLREERQKQFMGGMGLPPGMF